MKKTLDELSTNERWAGAFLLLIIVANIGHLLMSIVFIGVGMAAIYGGWYYRNHPETLYKAGAYAAMIFGVFWILSHL